MSKVVIVGAGISGLSLAYRLQQRLPSLEITVLEQRSRPGGTIWTENQDGFRVEIGPNGFLDNKPSTMALCREVGLGDQLVPATEGAGKNRYLFLGDLLQALPTSLASFVTSPLLSWRGKLSLLAERFRGKRLDQTDESIDAFVRRRAGREAAEVLADALVTGIHAGDPTLLSVRAAFPRLVELENRYGSVMKGLAQTARQRRAEAAARGEPYQRGSRMWSFRAGLRSLVEGLSSHLLQPPMLGVTIRAIARMPHADGSPDTWQVRGEGQDHRKADAVVLTCPAYQQAVLLADLDPELAQTIDAIAYSRVVVIALGYRQKDVPMALDGFGFIAPQRTRRDILGVQWCSSIFPERAPPGMALLRAMCGGWNRPDMAGWSDERLLEAVRAEMILAMGIRAAPVFHQIIRWERAIPQYHLGHLDRVAQIYERVGRHPGLFLGGNAYEGVALNDCTEQAEKLAERLAQYLRS